MRNRLLRVALPLFALATAAAPVAPALAHHSQPAFQPGQMDYTPIGYWGPDGMRPAGMPGGLGSATIPNPSGDPVSVGPNPSGKWVTYDTNLYEALSMPYRHPGDNCNSLPVEDQHPDCRNGDKDPDDSDPTQPGAPTAVSKYTGYSGPNGTSPVHGTCPPSPEEGFAGSWGQCFNNQLEYLDYYEHNMREMLDDFGVTIHRYGFQSPGTGSRGVYLDASGGQGYNIAAVVPGADHPEQTVLVSGHYDFTDSGPAAAWDSAEGHAMTLRMAFIMASYWKATGTRPSATVKFIPWDSEESGSHGSRDYVANNIPPGEEDKVRGYFNVDPCSGAYPAYKDGSELRVPQVVQLANPAPFKERDPAAYERILRFNQRAARDQQGKEGEVQYYNGPDIIDNVFTRLDDTITRVGGATEPIFVGDDESNVGASQRAEVVTALGGLLAFSSDYANFEAAGIPVFNFFPDLFGPHADLTPASAEGVSILHTNNDNLTRLNRLTTGLGPAGVLDPTGTFAAEGWAKGQEMCSQVEAEYMLQPEMSGAQTANLEPVAYFEALPNEAVKNQPVSFDAGGSHRILTLNPRAATDSNLTYAWDFGDGQSGNQKTIDHSYSDVGTYTATLTVTNTLNDQTDTMSIPIEVVPSNFTPPVLKELPAEHPDGNISLSWTFSGETDGLQGYGIQESKDVKTLLDEKAEGDPAERWTVEESPANPKLQSWQPANSDTDKFRGNQARSGETSFWAGASPQDFPSPPVNAVTTLTLKNPISVPLGEAELSYWSLFANESDDGGRLEVALEDDDAATPLQWQTIDLIPSAAQTCNPSDPPSLTKGFESRRVNLAPYGGKKILLRFTYSVGKDDKAASQPCGWYVDDVRVVAGTFSPIGTTGDTRFTFNRGPGDYAYRVVGIYAGGVETAPSNLEVTKVPGAVAPSGGPAGPGGPGGGGTPAASTSGGRALILRRTATLRSGRFVSVPLRCPKTATSDCKGTLSLYTVRSVKTSARLKLGAKRYVIAPGKTGNVRVRLSLKARRYVLKRRSMKVLAIARSGDKGIDRKTFTLRIPRKRG